MVISRCRARCRRGCQVVGGAVERAVRGAPVGPGSSVFWLRIVIVPATVIGPAVPPRARVGVVRLSAGLSSALSSAPSGRRGCRARTTTTRTSVPGSDDGKVETEEEFGELHGRAELIEFRAKQDCRRCRISRGGPATATNFRARKAGRCCAAACLSTSASELTALGQPGARRCTYLLRRANFRARKARPVVRWRTCPTRRANFPRSESWVTDARRRTTGLSARLSSAAVELGVVGVVGEAVERGVIVVVRLSARLSSCRARWCRRQAAVERDCRARCRRCRRAVGGLSSAVSSAPSGCRRSCRARCRRCRRAVGGTVERGVVGLSSAVLSAPSVVGEAVERGVVVVVRLSARLSSAVSSGSSGCRRGCRRGCRARLSSAAVERGVVGVVEGCRWGCRTRRRQVVVGAVERGVVGAVGCRRGCRARCHRRRRLSARLSSSVSSASSGCRRLSSALSSELRRTNLYGRAVTAARRRACRPRRASFPRWRADSLPRGTEPSAAVSVPSVARSDIVRARKAGVPDSACGFPSRRTPAEGAPSAARG